MFRINLIFASRFNYDSYFKSFILFRASYLFMSYLIHVVSYLVRTLISYFIYRVVFYFIFVFLFLYLIFGIILLGPKPKH